MNTFVILLIPISIICCITAYIISCFSERGSPTELISLILFPVFGAIFFGCIIYSAVNNENPKPKYIKCNNYQIDTIISMTNQVPTDTTYAITYNTSKK